MSETTARLRRMITLALMTGITLAAAACGSAAAPSSPAGSTATATPRPAAAATPVPPAPLACRAHARRHAVVGTLTRVRVRSAPHAWIAATAHYPGHVQKQGARASALGRHTFSYSAGRGRRVVVDIHASRHGRKGTCETSFKAHQPPPMMMVPAPAPPMPAPTPTPTMMLAPTPTPTMM
jgi:hypothetical protein